MLQEEDMNLLSGIIGEELGRYSIGYDACIGDFLLEFSDMFKRKLTNGNVLASRTCALTCDSAEYDNIKKRVAHKAILAVDAANSFACDEEVFNVGGALSESH